MSILACTHCNGPLALADALCPACSTPVPAATRRDLMQQRGQGLADAGRWAEAARSLANAPMDGLGGAEAKRILRLRALWLQRAGTPGALDEAEAVLRQVIGLDDGDDLSHQAWMDVLKRGGRLAVAKSHYQERLARDSEDAVAKHQLSVLRLSEDMLLAPVAKLSPGAEAPKGMLAKMIHPSTGKMITAGSVVLFGLGGMIWGFFSSPAAAPAAAAAAAGGGLSDSAAIALAVSSSGAGSWVGGNSQVTSLLTDPWINGIQVVLALAYLWWGWKERRG